MNKFGRYIITCIEITKHFFSHTLIVSYYFSANTNTDRAGYDLYIVPYGSGRDKYNSSRILNLTKFRKLRIASSQHKRPEVHSWTQYSNAGRIEKEIANILISNSPRILQNSSLFKSAVFFAVDHRLVAKLKLHIRFRRISGCNHTCFISPSKVVSRTLTNYRQTTDCRLYFLPQLVHLFALKRNI